MTSPTGRPMSGYEPATYGDRFADVYDEWYAGISDVDTTVADLVELAGDGPVLEFAIGTGRVAVPLAGRGVRVSGIELSAPMVERLRTKADAATIPVVIGDMATATSPGELRVLPPASGRQSSRPSPDTSAWTPTTCCGNTSSRTTSSSATVARRASSAARTATSGRPSWT